MQASGLREKVTAMRIEEELKLDFKDVLFRPKRSTLGSRAKVELKRTYKFRHSTMGSESVPIIAANMDTVGTFEMAAALAKHHMHVALHKHYEVSEIVDFFRTLERKSAAFYSMGIQDADEEKLHAVMKLAGTGADSTIRYLCIDVA